MHRSVSVVMTMALACGFWGAGCYRSAEKVAEPPPAANAPGPAEAGTTAPSAPVGPRGEGRTAVEGQAPSEITLAARGPAAEPDGSDSSAISGAPQGKEGAPPPPETARSPEIEGSFPTPERSAGIAGQTLPEGAGRVKTGQGADREEPPLPANAPSFAREREELVYRVEFLGLTMGYARFRFQGTVWMDGREAYHLTVRAWTSDLLAVFYPLNDTIEYYLDVETLAPIRQEFTNSTKEDDIAYYDQKTGKIVYRYKKNGKVRKQVDTVPGVYDPVSMVYYFRTRDLASEGPAHPLYAGRKLWEVSAKPLGVETIRTDRGQFDTVMIEPVLRREGKQEHQGNLRVWMTRDERHVPVRLYAKFKKVRIWTLVGELLPDRQGG